ncbi:hypothetical protein B0H63DRAFT_405344 [Podospora didyma]|uniref:Arrestin C-terminal-like domain-containing protein n=1 Tax=Podospora didyma TaxID=330526 RepID=A0AAE0N1B4_9PEZI|nr:hypothetical protein B0H63DRAFT_405344 [Podospora didyma]
MSYPINEAAKASALDNILSYSISTVEPSLFLMGFGQDGHADRRDNNTSTLLRGRLQLNILEHAKIRSVGLRLIRTQRVEPPEDVPFDLDLLEERSKTVKSLIFFQAEGNGPWETEYGNQCMFIVKDDKSKPTSHCGTFSSDSWTKSFRLDNTRTTSKPAAKFLKIKNVFSPRMRHFHEEQQFKVFRPGTYHYSFEIPVEHHEAETTTLRNGWVRWELQTTVKLAETLDQSLIGTDEVLVVRLPDQLSMEISESLSISYQLGIRGKARVTIFGKSFSIGTNIPISLKLALMANIKIHKLKVYLTERIEYWPHDRREGWTEGREHSILLLRKTIGKRLGKSYTSSDVRIQHGQKEMISSCKHTEIQMGVRIPTCEMMRRDKALQLSPDSSWKSINMSHSINIVLRLSDGNTGNLAQVKDFSFSCRVRVLNCRATMANMSLPPYSSRGKVTGLQDQGTNCGCPTETNMDKYFEPWGIGPEDNSPHPPKLGDNTPGYFRTALPSYIDIIGGTGTLDWRLKGA